MVPLIFDPKLSAAVNQGAGRKERVREFPARGARERREKRGLRMLPESNRGEPREAAEMVSRRKPLPCRELRAETKKAARGGSVNPFSLGFAFGRNGS